MKTACKYGISRRVQSVQSPIIAEIGQKIRSKPGTVSLGQGVVYYGPPEQALKRLAASLSSLENHKYSAAQGILELRDAIAKKLQSENAIGLERSEVVVTAGSNMGFYNAILTISDPGDEIIISRPYYFNHEMAITMAGCRPVEVPVDADYQLQPQMIAAAISERTRAIVTISPNNPTGAVYPEETLRAINELCRQRGIYHISDEAYESFVHGTNKHFSPAAIVGSSGHTISLFSLSKAYGFAGWRIGYMVIPQDLVDPVLKIQDTVQICPTVVSQQAAVGALQAGAPFIESKVGQIVRVRLLILDALGELEGLVYRPLSEGAFYILLKIHADLDDTLLVDQLIQHHRVAVIPGSAFGIRSGCYLRIAYGALDETTARCGVNRLVDGLREQLRKT